MTNFERYAESPYEMERLLSAATDAALRAKGCSVKLDFPPDGDWYEWLQAEEQDLPLAPPFPEPQRETAERYNAKMVTDKLAEIRDAIAYIQTPFAQAALDILDEAIESVEQLGGDSSGTAL